METMNSEGSCGWRSGAAVPHVYDSPANSIPLSTWQNNQIIGASRHDSVARASIILFSLSLLRADVLPPS